MSAQHPSQPGLWQPEDDKIAERARRYARGAIVAGKYRLEEALRSEASHDVWLATDRKLNLPVTLKIFHEEIAREWFESELSAAAFEDRLAHVSAAITKLSHPAIERVLDCAVTELGDAYLATERLDGESLASCLARERRLHPEFAIPLVLPILDGLDAAHGRGLVHGDLTPEKIFLARGAHGETEPKLIDLGVAFSAEGHGVHSAPYAAPEVVSRETLPDAQSDVWSVTAILYQQFGGAGPGGARTEESAVHRIPAVDPLDLVRPELCQGVDDALAAVIKRGLRRSRYERWESVNDLGEALAVWLVGRGIEEDCQGVSLQAKWMRHAETRLQLAGTPRASSPPNVEIVGSAVPRTVLAPEPAPYAPYANADDLPVEIPKRSWPGWVGLFVILGLVGLGVGVAVAVLTRAPAGVRAMGVFGASNLESPPTTIDATLTPPPEPPTTSPVSAPPPPGPAVPPTATALDTAPAVPAAPPPPPHASVAPPRPLVPAVRPRTTVVKPPPADDTSYETRPRPSSPPVDAPTPPPPPPPPPPDDNPL